MLKVYVYGLHRAAARWHARPWADARGFTRNFLVPTLAVLLLVPLFCSLGYWQLARAQEKRVMQTEYDRRATQAPIELDAAPRSAETLQYFRVQASGVYDTAYQVLWDNRIHRGAAGYHVLTPLRIAGGEMRVLVNRGWVPVGSDRDDPPAIDPPGGAVTVSGVAVVPHGGFTLGEPDALERTGPTVWQQLDLARYAGQVEWPLQPIVILLDPESPGGYVREWARLDAGIAVHQGYAFQWFTLAATVLAVYVVLLVRAIRRGKQAE